MILLFIIIITQQNSPQNRHFMWVFGRSQEPLFGRSQEPMYGTRPWCLVQAITRHTCPDPRETACLIRLTLHQVSRWAAGTSRVRVSTRSRPSLPPYPHFNRPSGFWPCVKSCLVGGSDKYSLPSSHHFPPTDSGNMCKYVMMYASTCANIHIYVRASDSTFKNILTFNNTQIIPTFQTKN